MNTIIKFIVSVILGCIAFILLFMVFALVKAYTAMPYFFFVPFYGAPTCALLLSC